MIKQNIKYHFIYKTINIINNEYYIGMHSTDNLDDGYLGSGTRLRRSIRKYGKENFVREIIEFSPNRELLKEREEEIVNNELLNTELCINLKVGGYGGLSNEEHRKKFIEASTKVVIERWKDDEFRKKMSLINSNTIKDTIKKGKLNHNRNTMQGKKHSKESIQKMKAVKSGHGLGKLNSQYATMWITNERENKKIGKNDLVPEGWRKGRVIKKY